MNCPFCRQADSRVVDSRPIEDGSSIRRRRECVTCGRRFTTQESSALSVVKRSGASEPFSREKVAA
ncbi:MAG: transcriptional regulator NrdR, partial [Actinobacteria bacterium]|nr:transcriptional regulator NrdR [Actinomycetota bacterium]MTA01304.1 transcriptional regulator NrdR [Actinomycetota bacterium]